MSLETFWNTYENHLRVKFDTQPRLEYFIREMRMAFGWSIQNQHIEVVDRHGGLALLMHSETNSDQQAFGFVIWPEDQESMTLFWKELVHTARQSGATKLTGPLQGTTYFPYRFVTTSDGSPFFKGEYFSEVSEHEFMMAQSPSGVNYFRSGYRTTFDGIMAVSKPYYEAAVQKGFSVETHAEVSEQLFSDVFLMVGEIFGGNWNFNDMSTEAVKAFYAHEFGVKQRMAVQTMHLNNELIGFCRYIENDSDTLICKTLGILPAYQKLGLGNAAVYEMHRCAQQAGYSRMIYALIYDGNRVQQNMPKDDSIIFRKYAGYEFDLNE